MIKENDLSMKTNFTISIAKPCDASWDEMTPNQQGKFCSQCSLTVVDFTKMNDSEIKEYFLHHYGQKTCGRFQNDQLHEQPSNEKLPWYSRIEKYYRISSLRTALLSLFALLAFLTGCRKPPVNHTVGKVNTMGEPSFNIENLDTIRTLPNPQHPIK